MQYQKMNIEVKDMILPIIFSSLAAIFFGISISISY